MSYLVLARKWRPRTFSQLVGQDVLVSALSGSLNKQRLHHAYLFTGTRGVGKTSVARLFAKALNCEQGISSTPCLQCDACCAIEQGRFVDLIEIDGASRTRVEDTRELLDNVMYSPTHGRFKIYLIDEVHMLSQHSFNALLKTLEEPPAHVKFLLATTDPQKLPLTVLSRCLQFHLKHISVDDIVQHLQHILTEEHCTYELDALVLVAKAAQGSMRDALSLLDQALAGIDTHLTAQHIKHVLGFTQQDYALEILQALVAHDPAQLMLQSQHIAHEGGHFRYVLDELLSALHQISLMQQLPMPVSTLEESALLRDLSTQFTPEDVQLFYHIVIRGADDLMRAPSMLIGFDMILLRMYTFQPKIPTTLPLKAAPVSIAPAQADIHPSSGIDVNVSIEPGLQEGDSLKKSELTACDTTMESHRQREESWPEVMSHLNLHGLTLNAAENAEWVSKSSHQITLRTAKGHQSLYTPAVLKRLEDALSGYYKENIRLHLEYGAMASPTPAQHKQHVAATKQHMEASLLQEDPFFQQLKEAFSAEIVRS